MTEKEILRKAIDKAKTNGFVLKDGVHFLVIDEFENKVASCQSIIFSHDFAKTFWGERFTDAQMTNGFLKSLNYKEHEATISVDLKLRMKAWRFHLFQMVLADDPIKYLEQFVKEPE